MLPFRRLAKRPALRRFIFPFSAALCVVLLAGVSVATIA